MSTKLAAKAILVALDALDRVIKLEIKMSEALDKINKDLADINTFSNGLATEVTALRDKVANGITPAEAAGVTTQLDGIAAKLQALAANPAAPVPVA